MGRLAIRSMQGTSNRAKIAHSYPVLPYEVERTVLLRIVRACKAAWKSMCSTRCHGVLFRNHKSAPTVANPFP